MGGPDHEWQADDSTPLLGVNGDPPAADSRAAAAARGVSHGRLASLDVMRGITMGIMILVNNGPQHPSTPSWWAHSTWDGLGLADVVMPFFLFMAGMSAHLSADALLAKGWTRWRIARRIAGRAAKLFFLGLLCQGLRSTVLPWPYVDLAILRIMGVLQRIALTFGFVSLVYLLSPTLRVPDAERSSARRLTIVLQRYAPIWAFALAALLAYQGVLYGVAVPDWTNAGSGQEVRCGGVRGDLGPSCNAPDFVDRLILTPAHMYTPAQEPEGLASSLSALGSVFAGLYFGLVLSEVRDHRHRLVHWTLAAAIMLTVGLALALPGAVPLNKALYSTSYVLVTAGMCGLLFAGLYGIMDALQWRSARWLLEPCRMLGMNAIAVYLGDSIGWSLVRLVYHSQPDYNLYTQLRGAFLLPDYPTYVGLHLWALTDLVLWTLVAAAMHRAGLFIKV